MFESTLIPTEDGSLTLRDTGTGELYHNAAGAYAEAQTQYALPADAPRIFRERRSLRILDVCFGLGYNGWSLVQNVLSQCPDIEGTITLLAVEQDPTLVHFWPLILDQPCFESLKPILPQLEHNIYYRTFEHDLELRVRITEGLVFELQLYRGDCRQIVPALANCQASNFDCILHDPFSPARAPELWTVDLFACYKTLLKPETGRLLTYSTAGAVLGGLHEAGFTLYRTPALGRKRGGTMATCHPMSVDTLPAGNIIELPSSDRLLLTSKKGIPYRDGCFAGTADTLRQRRQAEQSEFQLSPS